MREAQHHRSTRRGGDPLLRRLADYRSTECVGDDQAGIGGEYIAGHISVRGEEQPIAMPPIIHPFLIGAEVGNRRFYLHDDDFTVTAERDQVGPAP